ncbi:hypothetical protein BV25DRAFT_1920116 [Artomyces pyxidatus]|uniref:Uncharacterized protein n=1 Tax=Artomyces pyxidatus TaxID=48021 RepID=A0ACB8SP68_9AGAM|nr:hypothetical protein BV25DRAFT_1920116 [Artomyces pyxidatus]
MANVNLTNWVLALAFASTSGRPHVQAATGHASSPRRNSFVSTSTFLPAPTLQRQTLMAPRTRSQRNTPLDAAHPADPAAPVGQQGETLEMQTAESLQKAFAGFEQRGHDTKPMVVLVKGSVIFAPAPLPRALSIIMVLVLTALLVQFTLPGAGEHIRDLAIASCHSAIDTFLFLIDLNHQSVTVVRVFFTEAYLTLLDRVQGVVCAM